jgi:hypothetical protein
MNKVLIVAFSNVGIEYLTLRQVLEAFGFSVYMKYIGRPNHFIEVLEGNIEYNPDYIILSCHGEKESIVMPVLAENVYGINEPRGNFSESEIRQYLKLTEKIIISTGCSTGTNEMIAAFSNHQNTYIAPKDNIEGNSSLFFVISFFYMLSQNKNVKEAFKLSQKHDKETSLFVSTKNLFDKQSI